MNEPSRNSTANSPASRRRWFSRRTITKLAWAFLVIAIAAALSLARYEDPRRIASSGDSFWYMRQAQIFAGTDPATASTRASRQVCRDINRSAREQQIDRTCRDGYPQRGVSPRYIAIFGSRPGYPLFAAPFVKILGLWKGMAAATLILAVTAGLLMYLAVWLAFGNRLAGVVAAALIYLLPTGFWMTRMLADGAMLVGCLVVLIGAMLAWRGRLSGIPIAVAGLAWTFLSKSANGVAMALVLLVASIAAVPIRSSNRRGALLTGGLGLAALVGWFALSPALRLPSLNETIQDFATRHFTRPDIPDPYTWLWEQNLAWWPETVERMIVSPLPLISVILATVLLVARTRHVALLWLGTGLTGLVVLAAHPVDAEYERLTIPVWPLVAAAVGYVVVGALPARWTGAPVTDAAGDAEARPAPDPAGPEPASVNDGTTANDSTTAVAAGTAGQISSMRSATDPTIRDGRYG